MPFKMGLYLAVIYSITLALLPNKLVYAYTQPEKSAIEIVEALLTKPAAQIDLAHAKLTIDKLIDPSINIDRTMGELNYMVQMVDSAAIPNMSAMDRMQSLRTYLYDSGYWNNHQPFSYDFDDPMGANIQNKLLPTYLKTRKGNCISMPFLFVILAEKLGLKVTIAAAPLHVLVKFKPSGSDKWLNMETTDTAQILDDSFYRTKTPMTDLAIDNGLYLTPLNKKETVAVMAILRFK